MWDQTSPARPTIEWLLGPHTIDEFARDYYERAPLHVRRNREGFYDEFFSLSELERVILNSEIDKGGVFATKNGSPAREEAYLRKLDPKLPARNTKMIVDADRVGALAANGCSIVVDAIQQRSQQMAALCHAMEAFFRLPIGANVYLTPGGGQQGFSVHYDTHDAVIVQIEGTKQWHLYGWGTELALSSQRHDEKKHPAGERKLELEMKPGDLLYIPRGMMHEARSSDSLSLHVTIGLYPTLWIDVVKEAVNAAGDELALRRSTSAHEPANFDDPELRAALAGIFTRENLVAAEDRLRHAFETERRNDLQGQLRQIALLPKLGERSFVSMRPHMLYRLSETSAPTLAFSGKTLKLRDGAPAVIRALEGGDAVCVADLVAIVPHALDTVRLLIAEGFAMQREGDVQSRERHLRAVEDIAS